MAATAAGEASALSCQIWVLKVSIHCEGCKKKVERVLKSIKGVVDATIDSQQDKVTVIATGDVDADTLIKKLGKARKHAELWPEKAEKKDKNAGKAKNKENQNDPDGSQSNGGDGEKKPAKNIESNPAPAKDSGSGTTTKSTEGGATAKNNGGGGGQSKELKSEGKKPENFDAGNQSPAMEQKESESDGAAEKSGGGNGGKKKKKKGQKSNESGDGETSSEAVAATGSAARVPEHLYTNVAPSINAASDNTAHLSTSYSAAYYAPRPPYAHTYMQSGYYPAPPPYAYSQPEPYSAPLQYAYAQPESYSAPPPYAYAQRGSYSAPPPPPPPPYAYTQRDSYSAPRSSDSFEIFSDENPNSCLIM